MAKKVFCMLLCGFAFFGQLRAQEVFVSGNRTPAPASTVRKSTPPHQSQSVPHVVTVDSAKRQALSDVVEDRPVIAKPASADAPRTESSRALVMITRASASPAANKTSGARVQLSPAAAVAAASSKSVRPTGVLPAPATMRLTRVEGPAPEPHPQLPLTDADPGGRGLKLPLETAFVKLADGFDFPVGKPDAQAYYKARGFRSHGHLGEDWDGIRGGDTDLGDPIYVIGDGIVVFARDCHMGWGNVIIVRHSYRDGGTVRNVDSLYGHCEKIMVHRGQVVSRGQQIATIGTAHGLYDAHLHLEVRKNIEIGMSRAKFAQDSTNYYDPTQFINQHRHLQGGGSSYRVAMNTFYHDARINWAAVRNFSHSHHRGGTGESSVALKKAVAATKN